MTLGPSRSGNASPQSADGFAPNEPAATPAPEEHHKKHVAVPDISDGVDPWAARLLLLHPLRPLRPLDPLDSPLGSQPPHLLLRQRCRRERRSMESDAVSGRGLTGVATGRSRPVEPAISAVSLTMIRGINRRGTMPRRLRSQETTRGISLSPRLRLLRFLRQCRQYVGDDLWNQPNRFRSRLPAMTRGINTQAVPQSAPQATPHGDPWNQPQPAQPTPNADLWNSQPQPQPKPQPQVAAEDDEY